MAAAFQNVEEGTACTQSSFKSNGKSFLFVGMQGGRFKMMLKLGQSLPEAVKKADANPDDFQVGNTGWVTARFTAEKPVAARLWKKWLKESYELCQKTAVRKKK
jgi:hypothetical protein